MEIGSWLNEVFGYEASINEVISKFLNYKLIFNPYNKNTNEFYDENISFDFVIRTGLVRAQDQNDMHMTLMSTQAFTVKNQIILIPKSRKVYQFEKLFMPFEMDVWIWLMAMYFIATLVIFIFNFLPKKSSTFCVWSECENINNEFNVSPNVYEKFTRKYHFIFSFHFTSSR